MKLFLLIWLLFSPTLSSARQVLQVRPRLANSQIYYDNDNAQLSAAIDEDANSGENAEYVLASRPNYELQARALSSSRTGNVKNTLPNSPKVPPVQTIRNYNKVNDDGSFTFGYEAADGSFKEETRGTDCVVRGKYGYIDPDGNKREFTYVSGNPCDPNAPNAEIDDEDELLAKKQEEDDLNEPANYPVVRPVQAIRQNYPKKTTATTPPALYHRELAALLSSDNQDYKLSDESSPTILIKPTYRTKTRQNYLQVAPIQSESVYATQTTPRAKHVTSSVQGTTATPVYRLTTPTAKYQNLASPSSTRYVQQYTTPTYQQLESVTTRPHTTPTSATIAITPRPHIAQVAAQYLSTTEHSANVPNSARSVIGSTERPGVVYGRPDSSVGLRPASSALPANVHLNFAAELAEYVNTVPAVKNPVRNLPPKTLDAKSSEPIYQSELVYDPSSGQYKTQLYQTLPQSLGDFQVNHKLQPYVAQPVANQPPTLGLQQQQQHQQQQQQRQQQHQPQASAPVYSQPVSRRPQPQEKIYRQQQTEQFLQSQQLFAQQQRRQQQQQTVPPKYQLLASQKDPQSYYYAVSPSSSSSSVGGPGSSISLAQIDQFLRGSTATFH